MPSPPKEASEPCDHAESRYVGPGVARWCKTCGALSVAPATEGVERIWSVPVKIVEWPSHPSPGPAETYDKDAEQAALERRSVEARGLYRHYKGGLYIVFSTSLDEATGEGLVHYYSLEKRTRWTRTADNFWSAVVLEGASIPVMRFKKIREALEEETRFAALDNE